MRNILKHLLQDIVLSIENGTSHLTDTDIEQCIKTIKELNEDKYVGIYEACKRLNICERTFRNYRQKGIFPNGVKRQGYKELRWNINELKELIRKKNKI